jgi:fibronectin-binding autotransporter adhesin
MKTIPNHSLTSYFAANAIIRKLALCAVLLAATNTSFGQLNSGTARTWTGAFGDYKMGTASNWNPSGAPASGSGDIAIWDTNGLTGNVAGNVLQVTNAASNSSNPGETLQVTGNHTNGLTIVSTGSGNPVRLGTNSLVIASGSGPVSLGNSGANAFQVALALGAGNNNYFTNNSAYPATINSDVYWIMGGGNNHNITMCGTGDWNLYNQWDPNNTGSGGAASQMIINSGGTVTYAPTNAPGITFPAGGFIGITLNSGTFRLGNSYCLTNLAGALTLNGGTFDINGFSITNNLTGAANIDSSSGSPTLTVSNGTSSTFSGIITNSGSGVLALQKLGSGTLTLSGQNGYSGTTAVNGGTLIINGKIGSGTVTLASATTLGGTGTIGGNVNWQFGSAALFTVTVVSATNSTPLKVSGSVTLNTNAVTINVAGATPLPIGTYTLMNAVGGSTGQFVTNITSANYSGAGAAAGTLSSISTSAGLVTLLVTNAGKATVWSNDLAGGTSDWTVGTNWDSNPYAPTNAGDTAKLGVGSAVSTVNVNQNISLGGITFTNPNSFIVADTGKTLTLDNFGGGVTLAVNAGTSNVIATAVSLKDKTIVGIDAGMSLAMAGILSGTSGANTLTKNGNGTLVLAGNNTYGPSAGSIGTIFSGGTLELTNSHALGSGDLTNTANATLRFDAPMTLANKIWVNPASTVTLDDQGNAVTLAGGIGGAGSLNKSGAGFDIITNNGTSTIATLAVNGPSGTLEIASNTVVQASGQLFVENNNVLQIDSGATLNFAASGYGYVGNTTGTIATNIIYGTLNYSNANFVVGRNGGGNMTINSGRFLCNNFFVGQANPSDSGYLYLNGGSLVVNNVQSGNTGNAADYFYFNGGALVAKTASTTFWANNSLLSVYVQANPGTIDNGGNAITIAQSIYSETGTDGGMIFRGTNVTTLASANGYNGPTAVNAGTLLITGSIAGGNVTVASGAVLGGTGSVGGAVDWQTGSSAYLMVTNNGGANATPFQVGGAMTLNNNAVTINVAGGTPLPVGIYTLMYSGGIGSGHFATTPTYTGAGVAAGTVSTVSDDGYTVTLTVLVGGNTWNVDANGNWSTAADWTGNPVIPRLPGDTALFGVGSAYRTVTLDTNVSVASLNFTNPNSFFIANAGRTLTMTNTSGNLAINVSGGTSNLISAPIILNGAVGVSGTVGSGLIVSGNMSGPGGLNMGGDGTAMLTLSGSNTYSGATTVAGGGLVLGSTNAIGTNLLILNGCSLDSSVTNLVDANNNAQAWVGNIAFLGTDNLNLGNGGVVMSNSLTLSVTNKLVVGGAINGGSLTLTLNGSGTLELDGNNTFGTVNSGVDVLLLGTDSAAGAGFLNSYSPTAAFASSTSATRMIHNILGTGNGSFGWIFSGTGNLICDGGVTSYNFNKTVTVNNPVTTWNFALPAGAATTTKIGAGTLVFAGANANTGGNTVTEGTLALANSSALGTGLLTMNGGNLDSLTANLTNINNNTQTWNTNFSFLGSQSLDLGNGAVTMAANVAATVNANTLTVEGAIDDGGLTHSLTKNGGGTLVLDGANTYTGNTTVSNGVLVVNGSLSTGAVNIYGNGILAGSGVINGPVTDYPGMGIFPVDFQGSSRGNTTLTINNTLTMQGTVTMCITKTGGVRTNDVIAGVTTATYGGTLVVSNVTSDAHALTAGDTFPLFSATTHVGNFTNIVGLPGASLGYTFTNGVLSVVSTGPSGSNHLTNSITGGGTTLSLSWGAGWRLQMQTNNLSVGLNTNWVYITDGTLTSTNITIDPTKPAAFYRLTNP